MQRDQAPCLACETAVPERVRSCPACDYDLRRHERRRRWFGGLGTVLTLTVALAPLGLPMLYLAHQHRLAAEGSVTRRSEGAIGEDLRAVLADFLALERVGADGRGYGVGRRAGAPDPADVRRR